MGAVAALALLVLEPLAPGASAKLWFRVNDHVFAVDKPVHLVVPGCETGCPLADKYPGPIRIYLVPFAVLFHAGEAARRPGASGS